MANHLLTLNEIMRQAGKFDASNFLYLPFDERWDGATRCSVLPVSDIDGIPDVALENGLECAIQLAAIQDVVENLCQQVNNPDDAQLIGSFVYYYDNDAFQVL